MEKNNFESAKAMQEEFERLPERAKGAICWVVENFDFVINICKNTDMTDEEIEKAKERAREKEDYTLLALLCVAEMYKHKGSEAGKTPPNKRGC